MILVERCHSELESVQLEKTVRDGQRAKDDAIAALEDLQAQHGACSARISELETQLAAKEEEVEEADDRRAYDCSLVMAVTDIRS
jgi:DNA repair exonuclease SbcCD ATPase subunit